jgi:hypothetical protein
MDVGDEAVAAAVAREGNQMFWCYDWVLVADHGRQDSAGTLNGTKRTLKREKAEKRRGKPRQRAR